MHGKTLIAQAKTRGWVTHRKSGDHVVMRHPDRPDTLTVPYKPLNPGLVAHLQSKMLRGDALFAGMMNRGR